MSTHRTDAPDVGETAALRARFEAAAPEIEVEPWPLVDRGRRRRRAVRALGGVTAAAAVLALVVVLVPALGGGGGGAWTAGPPPEEPGPVSLWITADRVPPGPVELGAVIINRTDEDYGTGVLADVERWTDSGWREVGTVRLCQDHWECTGRVEQGGDRAAENLPVHGPARSAGNLERFTLDGMEPGWYRISRGDGVSSVVEVADGVPEPTPLPPAGVPGIAVQPAVVPPDGGDVVLVPKIPSVDGSLSAAMVEHATRDLSMTATVQRWTGEEWETVDELDLVTPEHQGFFEQEASVGPLDPGTYRLVRTGPDGDHAGAFWVADLWGEGADPVGPDAPGSSTALLELTGAVTVLSSTEAGEWDMDRPDPTVDEATGHVVVVTDRNCNTAPQTWSVREGVLVITAVTPQPACLAALMPPVRWALEPPPGWDGGPVVLEEEQSYVRMTTHPEFVPSGAVELTVTTVNDTDERYGYTVGFAVQRWVADGWEQVGDLVVDEGPLSEPGARRLFDRATSLHPRSRAVEMVRIEGLDPGWYRLARDLHELDDLAVGAVFVVFEG